MKYSNQHTQYLFITKCVFSQVVVEHSYCMPRPEQENQQVSQEQIQNQIQKDHGYMAKENKIEKLPKEKLPKQPRPRKQKEHKKLQELQNTITYYDPYQQRKLAEESFNLYSGVVHKVRDQMSEFSVLYEFLTKGEFIYLH